MLNLLKKIIPQPIINQLHKLKAVLAGFLYWHPKKIRIIGVTGTDGKTTTTFLIESILKEAGYKVALANGLVFSIGNNRIKNKTDNSTPSAIVLQRFLKKAKKANCDYLILEVTSWGLTQNRTWGIPFDGAVFTNLSHEHMDLHKTMVGYKNAKAGLFKALKGKKGTVSIINRDDPSHEFFSSFKANKQISYGLHNTANVYAKNILCKETKSFFSACRKEDCNNIELNVPGYFNVYNAMAAISLSFAENVKIDTIIKALKKFKGVKGRFEYVEAGQNFRVIVDFAHTPQAFKELFSTVRKIYPNSRLIGVYGATGGRDKSRRKIQGAIAARQLDFSVLTTEDPREEDPESIAKEIQKGLIENGKKINKDFVFIKDRKDAIKHACAIAKENDVVMILSMGHYEVMYVGKGKIKWNDTQSAIDCIKEILK